MLSVITCKSVFAEGTIKKLNLNNLVIIKVNLVMKVIIIKYTQLIFHWVFLILILMEWCFRFLPIL